MTILKWFSLIFLVLLLQTQVAILNTSLNLTVVMVYTYGLKSLSTKPSGSLLNSAEMKSTLFGTTIGLLEDILTGSLIGPALFSKGVAGLSTSIIFSDVVFRWSALLGGIVLFILTILDGATALGLRILFSEIHINSTTAFHTIGIQAIVNAVIGVLIKPNNLN